MKISLRDFIATGNFGAVELDYTRANVRAVLGEPPDWSSEDIPECAAIWKYGDIEFHFSGDILWLIFADDFEIPRGCAQFELDAWEIQRNCTPDEMALHLSQANIAHRVAEFPYADNGVRLICESGATLTFCGETPEQVKLVSVSISK